jgi:Xaa-Pro aminopeptidase
MNMDKKLYNKRISKLQDYMKEKNIDVSLLMDRENLNYFAGIEQVECMTIVVPKKGEPVGVTLWLDVSFIKENCLVDDIRGYVMPKDSVGSKVVEIIKEMGYENPSIGFERYFISYSFFNALRNEFNTEKFEDLSTPIYMMRSIKEDYELEHIRQASKAVVKGLEAVLDKVKPGVKEIDLAVEAEYAMMKAGSQGMPFRPQIVTGKKILSTHPFSMNTEIKNNSILIINMGASVHGYVGKLCRTVILGDVDQETINIYNAIQDTQNLLLDNLKEGITCNDLTNLALNNMDKYNYRSKYLYVIGYGVGLRQSEFYPVISQGNPTVLKENMVVDFLMPTVYDKKFGGPRLTDTILVKKDGSEVLSKYPNDIIRK